MTLYKVGEVYFRLLGTNGFSCKGREWKIYCCGLALSSEPQIREFHVVIWQTMSTNCAWKRAARAARLFFLIQPMKSLICGVVLTVALVISFNSLLSLHGGNLTLSNCVIPNFSVSFPHQRSTTVSLENNTSFFCGTLTQNLHNTMKWWAKVLWAMDFRRDWNPCYLRCLCSNCDIVRSKHKRMEGGKFNDKQSKL